MSEFAMERAKYRLLKARHKIGHNNSPSVHQLNDHQVFNELFDIYDRITASYAMLNRTLTSLLTDSTTGLPSRDAFERRKNTTTGSGVCVVFFDVIGLKAVNDNMGYEYGDEMLRILSRVLSQHSREGDETYRYGGDEFLLILNNYTETNPECIANRINQAFQEDTSAELGIPAELVGVRHGIASSCEEQFASITDPRQMMDELIAESGNRQLAKKSNHTRERTVELLAEQLV